MIALDTAFDPGLTPHALWLASEKLTNDPAIPDEITEALAEYATTLAEIQLLPEVTA